MRDYLDDSILMLGNGWLPEKFSENACFKHIFPEKLWQEGDELIVIRDFDNSIWFGINDDNNLVKAFDNIRGNFRIVIGFSNTAGDYTFEMVYLNRLIKSIL